MKNIFSISVILPVYNGEKYLAEAIQSVRAQTPRVTQTLIVDDGSTDGTAQVAAQFGSEVEYIRQANAGTSAARNHGVELARGNFLAFLDADDLWTPDKLALQLAAFESDPGLEAVFGHVEQFVSPEIKMQFKLTPPLPGFFPGTLLIRRKAFLRVGFFETTLEIGETIDWHARAIEKKLRYVVVPPVVYRRRLHGSNQGVVKRDARIAYVRAVKSALDRRRGTEH